MDICEPQIIGTEKIYEAPGEYSVDPIYNCSICCEYDCEFYKEYS